MTQDDKYTPAPDTFPSKGTNGSGTDSAFSVQARMAYWEPKEICGHLLDTRWRTIHFQQSPIGVPTQARYCPWGASLQGLMTYQAAEALRWWFMAQAAHSFDHLCLETRIVKHKVTYSFSEEAVGAGAVVNSPRDNIAITPPIPKEVAA